MISTDQAVFGDFSKITDQIYVGGNSCCHVRFAAPLLREGITADLSLEEDRVDVPFGVSSYLWLPVPDLKPPTFEQFSVGIAYIRQVLELGQKVFVHCTFGHGRGPTMVVAYLMSTGVSLEEATALLKARRPVVHLEDEQLAGLAALAARWRR